MANYWFSKVSSRAAAVIYSSRVSTKWVGEWEGVHNMNRTSSLRIKLSFKVNVNFQLKLEWEVFSQRVFI